MTLQDTERELAELFDGLARLRAAVGKVFLGARGVVDLVVESLLAGGHVLLEGAPGLGKTTLVRAIAGALDLSFQRIQFTPDLMPGDVLGTRILEEDPSTGRRGFRFERGPIFANVVLADEVNRATPRTQSALLEAMQEGQVTVHGESLALEPPFHVIATENPIEMEGTYPLPEAQLDRFLCKVELEPPDERGLVAILDATTGPREATVERCFSREQLLRARGLVREVPVSSDLVRLVARVVRATEPRSAEAPERVRRLVRWGSSPRGGQAVLLLAKARALAAGRLHVSRGDVEAVLLPALRHRLVLGFEGEASGVRPDELVREALAAVG